MANSYVTYTGDGATVNFAVPFPYLDRTHVAVKLDDVVTTAYTWLSDGQITMTTAPAIGVEILIDRTTSLNTPLVDFTAGFLSADDLDTAYLHSFYLSQEAVDKAGVGAAQSAIDAALSSDLAEKWANEDEDVVVQGGEFSAKHYVAKAAESAEDAAASAASVTTIAFSAHKNGVDQGGILPSTDTPITFGTEEFDVGGHYDAVNSRFQPSVPGQYRISAQVLFSSANVVVGEVYFVAIHKNGSRIRLGDVQRASVSNTIGVGVTALVDFNGTTDYVEIYALGGGAGNKTVNGTAASSYFCGEKV